MVKVYTYPLVWATLQPQYTKVKCPDCGHVFRALLGEETTCRKCGRVFVPERPYKTSTRTSLRLCKGCGAPIPNDSKRKYCKRCSGLRRYNQKLRLQMRRSHLWLMDVILDIDALKRGEWRPYVRERKLLGI